MSLINKVKVFSPQTQDPHSLRAIISSNVSEFKPHAISVQGLIIGVITMDKIIDAPTTGPDVCPPHSRRGSVCL